MVMNAHHSKTQLRLIVNGVAGTGKSHTFSAISHALPENIIRCAFTAKAAFLIRGQTLHATFQIPVESRRRTFAVLNGEIEARFQKTFQDVSIILIDETPC